jgi:hypothetical protein
VIPRPTACEDCGRPFSEDLPAVEAYPFVCSDCEAQFREFRDSAEPLWPTKCPGCKTELTPHQLQCPSVICPNCRSFRYKSGILWRLEGPLGTLPDPIQNHPPGWIPVDPGRQEAVTTPQIEEGAPRQKSKGKVRVTVAEANQAMIDAIDKDPERIKWSARVWARYVRCSTSTISKTEMWEQYRRARERAKQERMQQTKGKRKRRHYSQA